MDKRIKRKTLLIVDDQEIDFSILNAILSQKYNVLMASNGKEALKLLKSKKGSSVELIVSYLFMPVMDGLQLIEALNKDESLKSIPILVATEKGTSAEEEKLLDAGAWDFFAKPFNSSVLLLRIQNALDKS